jgi:5-methylcytosine-specific restriction endonuclease McrA
MIHSPLYRSHVSLQSPAWQQIRGMVIARAHNRCERCRDYAALEVHHKHYHTLGREALP